jgi:hypothetical protein
MQIKRISLIHFSLLFACRGWPSSKQPVQIVSASYLQISEASIERQSCRVQIIEMPLAVDFVQSVMIAETLSVACGKTRNGWYPT